MVTYDVLTICFPVTKVKQLYNDAAAADEYDDDCFKDRSRETNVYCRI